VPPGISPTEDHSKPHSPLLCTWQEPAVWLLPVVAAEVAAASGGLLAPHLADAHAQKC